MSLTLDGSTGISSSGAITTSSSLTTGTGAIYNSIQSGTVVASTSGTSIDFTSIPNWIKRITIQLRGVSLSGTSSILFQLGNTTFVTSGYIATSIAQNTSSGAAGLSSTSGIPLYVTLASNTVSGLIRFETLGSNSWVAEGNFKMSTSELTTCAGDVSLSSSLDRVRITTVNGTDTFDAGSINIMYEG